MTKSSMEIRLTIHELNVLSVLDTRKMYGYEIKKQLKGHMLLGSLYNVMKKLEDKDLVESEWGSEEVAEGARRKYYEITALGGRVLNQAKAFYLEQWGYNSAVL